MKKPAPSTIGKNKKPVAGRIRGQQKGVPIESSGSVAIGGKCIPYHKTENPDGYIVTYYGSTDATAVIKNPITLLIKHERRGGLFWGTTTTGEVTDRGRATQRLQGIYNTTRGHNLFIAVRHLRQFPETIDSLAGLLVIEAIMRDIKSGGTYNINILGKCIEAVEDLRRQETKGKVIVDLLLKCANKLGRIPTKAEIQVAAQYDERIAIAASDEGNFSKDLKLAGLGWLPVRL